MRVEETSAPSTLSLAKAWAPVAEALGQALEEGDVPLPPVAEPEVLPDVDFPGIELGHEEAGELLGTHLPEVLREGDLHEDFDSRWARMSRFWGRVWMRAGAFLGCRTLRG